MTEAMKYDGEKVRLDLLPADPIIDIGKVLTYGAKKYSERNWERGLAWSRCYGAALRHLLAWHKGETADPETGLNHLAHAACEILFLLEFSRTHPELDDRPKSKFWMEVIEMKRDEQPKTLRDVVFDEAPETEVIDSCCPDDPALRALYTKAGYVYPEGLFKRHECDTECCEACWNRPAEKLAPEKPETPDAIKPADTPSPDLEQKSWIELVEEFNKAYGVKITTKSYASAVLQKKLIDEEYHELDEAFDNWTSVFYDTPEDAKARKDVLDAICDSIYVLIGLALKMGMNLDDAFREVHRSNMSKLGEDGKPIKRADGKVLKGPHFTPPRLEAFI